MSRRARSSQKRPATEPAETRAAEFMTVGWMVAVMITLACELFGMAAAWYIRFQPEAKMIGMLSAFLLFVALVTGTISLLLAAIVWKARRVPPPLGVMVFAVSVGLGPLLILWLR